MSSGPKWVKIGWAIEKCGFLENWWNSKQGEITNSGLFASWILRSSSSADRGDEFLLLFQSQVIVRRPGS